jgi:RNA polymerase sigma factor (sigma-70 family)
MRPHDDQLFARFCQGDPAALAELFDRTAPELLRVAVHLSGDPARGEDLVQETFVTAIEQRRRFDARAGVVQWLFGILGNLAQQQRRRERRAPDPGRLREITPAKPEQSAAADEFTRALSDALAALPEVYRPVVTLHLEHGLTAKEIGAALGRPAGTVRTQVVRGLEQLRRLLPAGLAIGATVLTATRGLAAVRTAVVERAVLGASAVAGGTTVAGVLSLRALGAVLVAVMVAGAWLLSDRHATPLEQGAGLASAAPQVTSAADLASDAPAASAPTPAPLIREPIAATTTPATSLDVRVAWSDATPAAGVAVCIARLVEGLPPSTALLRLGRTDASGRLVTTDLAPGRVHVLTDRDGGQDVHLLDGRTTSVTLKLEAGVGVRGEVVDAAGRAVPHAIVHQLRRPFPVLEDDGPLTQTDAHGRFEVRDLGVQRSLWAEAPGLRPSHLQSVTANAGATVTRRLVVGPAGQRLQGRVRAPDGTPLPRAHVGIALPQPDHATRGVLVDGLDVFGLRADEEGRFAADWLPVGSALLLARAADSRDGAEPIASARVEVRAAGDAHVDVVVDPLPAIHGVVRDASGNPVAGRRVTARTRQLAMTKWRQLFGTVASTTDGSYRLRGVLPGRVCVSTSDGSSRSVEREVEVTPGSDTRCDLRAAAQRDQRVVLTAPDSQPLANWHVGWSQRAADGAWRPVATATTDAQGVASGSATGAGPTRISVHRPDRGDVIARVVAEAAADAPEVRIALRPEQMPSAKLVGRVLSTSGDAIADARVELTTDAGATTSVQADRDGRFALGPTIALPLRARVHAVDHAPYDFGTVHLLAQRALDLGDIRLPAPARIRVRPRGAGIDLGSLRIALGTPGQPTPPGNFAPASGEHVSPPLSAGAYVLYVHGPGVHPVAREVRITPGEDLTVDVELVPAPHLTCTITFAEATADAGIAHGTFRIVDSRGVDLVHEAVFAFFTQPGAQQRHQRLGLAPGRYAIEAQQQGGRTVRHEFAVPAQGECPPIALDLR